jgi:phosphohistidine phosphatase
MDSHRLLLIRHAKTGQGSPDRDRRLTDRGERDAREIGTWLSSQGVVPDLVVVSPATRARQTWELTGLDRPAKADERIYDNTVDDLLAVVAETDESVGTLAIVGHNPSIEAFTLHHGGTGEVSTGTVVRFALDGTWTEGAPRYVDVKTCRG